MGAMKSLDHQEDTHLPFLECVIIILTLELVQIVLSYKEEINLFNEENQEMKLVVCGDVFLVGMMLRKCC